LLSEAGFTDLEWGEEIDVFAGSSHEADASEFETRGITLAASKPVLVGNPERALQGIEPAGLNIHRVAVRRMLTQNNLASLQLHFDAAVLERYRQMVGFSVTRTNAVGRLKKQGGWYLDFGIDRSEELIHASAGDLASIPEEERRHWAGFAVSLPVSRPFIQSRLTPGSCFDDGDVRSW